MKFFKLDVSAKLMLIAIIIYAIAQSYIGLPEQIISWDAFGYYLYLPFAFIYGDLTFSSFDTVNTIVDQYQNTATLYQFVSAGNGNMLIKYPLGLALLESPFFALGHFFAWLFNYKTDGFSAPYQIMMFVCNSFYVVLGTIYLRKTLLKLFTPLISGVVLFIVLIGTNYLATGTIGMGNSHIPLFALHAIGIYLVIKWHESPNFKLSIILGSLIGLMIITRPTEILFLLLPIFWEVRSMKGFFLKYINLFKQHLLKLVVMITALILVGCVQLTYWKLVSGNWIFYSYDNPGEGFEFFQPYTIEYLFSFRKGWLLYTPIMTFALIGVFMALSKKYKFGLSLFLFTGLNLWVVSSWSCWWYAGSFGQRSIVQSYPEMALALGVFITFIINRKFLKYTIGIIGSCFVLLNLFQTWQMSKRIIHPTRMSQDYYLAIFGATEAPYNAEELMLVERATVGKAKPTNLSLYKKDKELIFEKTIHFNSDEEFVDFPRFALKDITDKDHCWFKITGKSKLEKLGEEEQYLLVNAFTHDGVKYNWTAWSPTEMKANPLDSSIVDIEMWYISPEARSLNNEFVLEIWNRAKSEVTITDLKVETFIRK
ncbi:MAG: hypothetical protein MK105_08255 [Crocinitomicaceae bacterium]|nr:hypothetical protein [Crocinitomicaceae bacterium]